VTENQRARAIVLCAAVLIASCAQSVPHQASDAAYELTLSFKKGAASTGNIIYVIWLENPDKAFVRYLFTCERLDYLAFKGTDSYSNIFSKATCPYWRKGLYETTKNDGVDVMSGATQRGMDFSTTPITLPAGSPSRFTVYFEIDRSFDPNDWWTDQPALLYAADVELDGSAVKTFPLTVRGWSRNAGGGSGGNENNAGTPGDPPSSAVGDLRTDMRYITNSRSGTAFGAAYAASSSESAANMVGSITLAATKK
jgi:hypothetical protein